MVGARIKIMWDDQLVDLPNEFILGHKTKYQKLDVQQWVYDLQLKGK